MWCGRVAVEDDVAVTQRRAFRRAGRARRVEQHRDLVAVEVHRARVAGGPRQPLVERRVALRVALAHHHVRQRPTLLARDVRQQVGDREEYAGPRVGENVLHLVRFEDGVDRYGDGADLQRAEVAHGEGRDVRKVERHAITALHAVSPQRIGQATGVRIQLAVRDGGALGEDGRLVGEPVGGALDGLCDVHATMTGI